MASVSHLYKGNNHTHFRGLFDALNEMILGNLCLCPGPLASLQEMVIMNKTIPALLGERRQGA